MKKIARDYCFTTYDLSWQPEDHADKLQFCVWQHEKCPSSGREHIQGYAEFKTKVEWDIVKSVFDKAHVDPRRGTQKQAIDYCTKKESQIEPGWNWGTMHKQGARNDLKRLQEQIIEGDSLEKVADDNFDAYIKYTRGIDKYIWIKSKDRSEMPNITIIWGKSGVGKTRLAHEMHKDIYHKEDNKWWDGYEQNECILIDDFDNSWEWKRAYWLKLLDRYPLNGEIKGGTVKINSPNIIITSNTDPKTWKIWDDAFERRIKNIIPM